MFILPIVIVAFEQVCWTHIPQIKRALGIDGVKTSICAWNLKGVGGNAGIQVDLLIFRADNVVNLCEMKFCSTEYSVDKDEERRLIQRVEALKTTISGKDTVHLTLITTYGLIRGKHSGKIQKLITADDLFL